MQRHTETTVRFFELLFIRLFFGPYHHYPTYQLHLFSLPVELKILTQGDSFLDRISA
jgi:hypothetical protein